VEKAEVELEALQSSTVQGRDLLLSGVDGPSSLVKSMSALAELLRNRIDAAAANRVHWGSRGAQAQTQRGLNRQ
jgi:hypothetical protein